MLTVRSFVCRSRIWVSLIAGLFAGISGVTGYRGALVYLAFHAILGVALFLVVGGKPAKYFVSPSSVLVSNIFAQQELLTFLLFWTLANNVVYLF